MRRFFLPGMLTEDIVITGQDARHICRVLRMKPGDEIAVAWSDGYSGAAVITEVSSQAVVAVLKADQPVSHAINEPPIKVALAQCLPKSDKMDFIVQKAVELGVAEIYPVSAERSVVKYADDKLQSRQQRWQKIAVEASKQCRRSIIPSVHAIASLEQVLAMQDDSVRLLMLYEGVTPIGIKEFLTADCCVCCYLLLIGPEGGFTADELALCRRYGVHFLTMGPRILRTETAALTALGIVLYEKGDLGGNGAAKSLGGDF